MATNIDHLRVDHRITILRDFMDARGAAMRAGDTGVLRKIDLDQIRMDILLKIECATGMVTLVFPLRAKTGPRNSHMREYFELGEDVTPPRVIPALHDPSKRLLIIPRLEKEAAPMKTSAWARAAQSTDGPDRLEAMEEEMRRSINHIGVAASIAEMYAQRMRAFQQAGNEVRAIAAFNLAVDWMGTYAGSPTSGGRR